MANTIDVIFNGVDKVSGVVNKITSANEGNAKSLLAMVGGYAAVGAAAYKMADYISDAAKETVAYGKTVRDMSRITGDSAEETSRLIQVTDDLVISQGDLEAAMRGAVQKGVDTSIDGMARLSDEYLKLDEGLERSEFLVDKFGRSGLKMGALMEQGGAGIREMAGAIDDSLIMTDQAIKDAREYEIAMDGLNDAFLGVKYTVGKAVIPALTDLSKVMKDVISGTDEVAGQSLYEKFKALKDERTIDIVADQWKAYSEKVRKSMEDSTESVEEGVSAVDEAIQKQRENLSEYASDWTKKFSDQTDAMGDLLDEQRNLAAEKETLLMQGWWPESEAVQDVTDKMSENITKIDELMVKQDEERLQMLANIATQGLDEDAKYGILHAMGLIEDDTANLISSVLAAKEEFARTGDLEAYYKRLEDIYNGMSKLDGKVAITKVITQEVIEQFASNAEADAAAHGYAPPAQDWDKFAAGGSFTVPPGYPNDSYGMYVSSGEHVQVTPAGQKTSTGNTIILNYSPVVSLADRYEAETKLVPYIESALRKIR